MKSNLEILSNRQALIERSLALIIGKIDEAIEQRGQFTIALSGGSTPKPLYEAIANCSLPWEKIHVFWGDERYVRADRPDSNQLMARQAWLDRVEIPAANIHPMPTDANDPQTDADNYERELQQFFQISTQEFPVFDLMLLGMGDDGHTASLFPHTQALNVRDRSVTVGNKGGSLRLTLTVPALNASRCVVFLIAGANKQPALEQVFAPEGNDLQYPTRLIQPQGELWWLLDSEAGEQISKDRLFSLS
jgi:6-phosphogluconolactonase